MNVFFRYFRMFFSWTLLLVLLVTLIAFWAIKRWRSLQVLQALGYPGPPLSSIGGNLLELVTKNDLETQIRWMTEVIFAKDSAITSYEGEGAIFNFYV